MLHKLQYKHIILQSLLKMCSMCLPFCWTTHSRRRFKLAIDEVLGERAPLLHDCLLQLFDGYKLSTVINSLLQRSPHRRRANTLNTSLTDFVVQCVYTAVSATY
jgi:hypothetical protein